MIKKLPGLLFLDGRVTIHNIIVNNARITSITNKHELATEHPTTVRSAAATTADGNEPKCKQQTPSSLKFSKLRGCIYKQSNEYGEFNKSEFIQSRQSTKKAMRKWKTDDNYGEYFIILAFFGFNPCIILYYVMLYCVILYCIG